MFHSTCESWMLYGYLVSGVDSPVIQFKQFFHYYEILQLRKIAVFMLSLFHRRNPITPIQPLSPTNAVEEGRLTRNNSRRLIASTGLQYFEATVSTLSLAQYM